MGDTAYVVTILPLLLTKKSLILLLATMGSINYNSQFSLKLG